jgi:hypothetical protein
MARHYIDTSQLPVIPDPQTGIPRPSHAPLFLGGKSGRRVGGSARDVPSPPEGQGPVLDWNGSSRMVPVSLSAGLMLAAFVGIVLAITRGIDWVEIPAEWGLIALTVLMGYSGGRIC